MLRVLLHYLLPLVLPTLLYVSYVYLTDGVTPGWIARAPWAWLLGAGAALVCVSLITWGLIGGADPASVYVPPHIEDGRVVPGRFVAPES